jgi:hypothetical protein
MSSAQKSWLAHKPRPISLRRFPLSAQPAFPHLELGNHPELCQEQLMVEALNAADVHRWSWTAGTLYSVGLADGPCW